MAFFEIKPYRCSGKFLRFIHESSLMGILGKARALATFSGRVGQNVIFGTDTIKTWLNLYD